MSRGVPTIVLLDLSANVLVVVVILLVIAMMRPVATFERAPVAVPIIAEAPSGALALVDALFGRTRPGGPSRTIDVTEAGVRIEWADGAVDLTPDTASFAATLAAALGGQDEAVDIFVFDPRHHAAVRGGLAGRANVREVSIPEALRSADGSRWNPAFADLFGRMMTEAEFRRRLAHFLAGKGQSRYRREASVRTTEPVERSSAEWLVLSGRLILFAASLAALWRVPGIARGLMRG